eukprot:5179258-Pyramimonas_sp.AAC.1
MCKATAADDTGKTMDKPIDEIGGTNVDHDVADCIGQIGKTTDASARDGQPPPKRTKPSPPNAPPPRLLSHLPAATSAIVPG